MRQNLLIHLAALAICVSMAGCARKVTAKNGTPSAPTPQPFISTPAPERAPATPSPEPRTLTPTQPTVSQPTASEVNEINRLLARIQDIYFDYDKHTLRPESIATLQTDAKAITEIVGKYPDFKLTVEGHCDERGSAEYNIGLGDARATRAKEYLVSLGLPVSQLNVVSYGNERQVCSEHDESCWQKNRRAHLAQVR